MGGAWQGSVSRVSVRIDRFVFTVVTVLVAYMKRAASSCCQNTVACHHELWFNNNINNNSLNTCYKLKCTGGPSLGQRLPHWQQEQNIWAAPHAHAPVLSLCTLYEQQQVT